MLSRKKLRDSKLVRISSKDRDVPTTSNKYNFSISFNDQFLHQVSHVILKSVLIPNGEYNVNSKNNQIDYNPNSTGDKSITIPVGQYNLNDFMTEVQNQFTLAGDAVSIVQNALTLKLELTFLVPTVLYASSTAKYKLGFSDDTANILVHALPNLPDLSGLKKVYIKSNTLSNSVSMSNSSKKHYNIFSEVDIDKPFGSVVHRVLDDLHSSDFNTSQATNLSNIDIQLLDQNLEQVDLNGLDFEIILRVFN